MSLYSLFCFRGGNCAGRDWSSALGSQGFHICANCMSSRPVIFSLCVSAEEKHSFSRTLLIWETLFPCSLLHLYWCEWSCWAACSFFMKLWLLMYSHKGLHNTKQRWKLRCQVGESSEQSGFLCSYLCADTIVLFGFLGIIEIFPLCSLSIEHCMRVRLPHFSKHRCVLSIFSEIRWLQWSVMLATQLYL